MKVVSDWHCPDLLSGPGNYQTRYRREAHVFEEMKRRRSAIQAGGHIGIVPIALAALFDAVYTFEPAHDNFEALTHNLPKLDQPKVFAFRACLGNKRGPRGLRRSDKSSGQHFVRGEGGTPVIRIDDLQIPDVDLIFLDIEGFEFPALQGAEETIRSCRPLIVAENNRQCTKHGFKLGDLDVLMRSFDYRLTGQIGEDCIFQHRKAQ